MHATKQQHAGSTENLVAWRLGQQVPYPQALCQWQKKAHDPTGQANHAFGEPSLQSRQLPCLTAASLLTL